MFKKGHKTNVGRKHTETTKEKHRRDMLGEKNPMKRPESRKKVGKTIKRLFKEGKIKPNQTAFKKGNTPWNKNKSGYHIHTEEEKKRIGERTKGKRYNLGRKQPMEELIRRSVSLQGIELSEWKGFITPFRIKIWHSDKYKNWRKSVFERDNYTCQECYIRGREIQAHHIVPFCECLAMDYKDLIFDIDNGLTLCKKCHMGYNGVNQHSEIIKMIRDSGRQL